MRRMLLSLYVCEEWSGQRKKDMCSVSVFMFEKKKVFFFLFYITRQQEKFWVRQATGKK